MYGAIPVTRGCGTRKKGGIYLECGLSEFGKPAEEFLVDPIQRIDPIQFGLTAINQRMIQDPEGTYHILDWIGQDSYPNPTDWFEEVRRFGMSNRTELSQDKYSLLTPFKSNVLAVHKRAWVNYSGTSARHFEGIDPRENMSAEPYLYTWDYCPLGKPLHDQHHPDHWSCCAGVMWSDLLRFEKDQHGEGRETRRVMPSFSYWGALATTLFEHQPGIFARFPITRIVVIKDPDNNTHEEQVKKLRGTKVPFEIVDE